MNPAVLIAAATLGTPTAGFTSQQVIAAADGLVVQQKACGPVSAYFLARRHGVTTRYADFTRGVTVDDTGVSLDDVDLLLTRAGIACRVVRAVPDDLDRLPTPCIIVIRPSHCVVLDKLDPAAGTARIFEPASRKVQAVGLDYLRKNWTGDAVVVDSSRPTKTYALAAVAACLGGGLVLGTSRVAARRTPPGGSARCDHPVAGDPASAWSKCWSSWRSSPSPSA